MVSYLNPDRLSKFAFDYCHHLRFAFDLPADYTIDFPVPELFSGIYNIGTLLNTIAEFQVPEELFQRIKDYLNRNHMTQKQFLLGLIERELDREQSVRESENAVVKDEREQDEDEPEHSENSAVSDFEGVSDEDAENEESAGESEDEDSDEEFGDEDSEDEYADEDLDDEESEDEYADEDFDGEDSEDEYDDEDFDDEESEDDGYEMSM